MYLEKSQIVISKGQSLLGPESAASGSVLENPESPMPFPTKTSSKAKRGLTLPQGCPQQFHSSMKSHL